MSVVPLSREGLTSAPVEKKGESTNPREDLPLVRVADQLVQAFVDAGVRAVFGVPGGSIAPLFDALIDERRIQVVPTHHEASAVFAAAAFARATGSVGVVLVTSGPGVTNTITGVASAFCDGLPVLVIGGEVPRKNFGRGGLQEGSAYTLNLVSMMKNVTKYSGEVFSSDGAVAALRRGLSLANSGRKGPVFLSMPLDIQSAKTSVPRLTVNVESTFRLDRSTLNAAVNKLLTCKRGMILAGSGCRFDHGPKALKDLAERFGLPVATTPKAKGVFPESHPLSLGIYGHGGHPSSTEYLEGGVDVLLAVGTSFGDAATNSWTDLFRSQACFIQVDVESSQIGKNYTADIGIVGAAVDVLDAIAALAPPARPTRPVFGRRTFKPADQGDVGPLTPQRALWELQQLLPTSTAYTCDIGEHMMFALHYLSLEQPDSFYLSSGLAAMGSSLSSALGVKLADPDRPVVAICGDGTMSMSGLDVATAARMGLNILFVVLNDGRYGMVEEGNLAVYGRTPAYPVMLDIGKMAEGMGARSYTISQPGELLGLGSSALLNGSKPVVLDIRIDRAEKMPRRARFDSLKHFVAGGTVSNLR
jgi:acetolactate synthase I/II/III large subunit